MTKNLDEYLSPTHKVLAFLKDGHERLREKYRLLREQVRTNENQVRAVTKSRDTWRQRAETADYPRDSPSDRGRIIATGG